MAEIPTAAVFMLRSRGQVMVRCPKVFVVALLHFVLSLGAAIAQEAETDAAVSNPNILMANAIELYQQAEDASGQQRQELLRSVSETLAIISDDFPDSVPAQFMSEGKPLGPIDMVVVSAAKEATYLDDLPQTTITSVFKTAELACRTLAIDHCEQEIAEALFEYIAVLTLDLGRASNVEQLKWLFSNPGRFSDNLTRVNAFNDLMENSTFRGDFLNRVNRRVISDMAVEATADLAFSLVTGVVSETLAQHYEAQGYQEAANFTRTWMEPMVDISLALEGASTASTAGAGAGAALIWAKNTYAFWQLGEKQFRAEQTGATADQQLGRLAAEIDSYTRTLISGQLTGTAFEDNEGAQLTEQHAEVIKSVLEDHYEMQQYWLSSDDAVLLETFDAVLQAARAFYETMGRLAEPTPLDAADSSGALPADLQGFDFQPAPDGFLGLPAGLSDFVEAVEVNGELFESVPGSELRSSILNAVRPVAEDAYGPPVEFIVGTMRVQGDLAFVELNAQRPGGLPIDETTTPLFVQLGGSEGWNAAGDNLVVSGFLKLQGSEWNAYDIVIGASEAWWVGNCSGLERLMPETCGSDGVSSENEEMVASSEVEDAIAPIGSSPLTISAGFFDPDYPTAWNPPAQHLGTDLPAPEDTTVRSPVAGQVVLNRTDRADAFNKYLIIRDQDGLEHVFAHLDSNLVVGQPVGIGDDIGAIVTAGTGPHLHWGINQGSIASTFSNSWGFGRAPLSATEADARDKGWLDPAEWFASRSSPRSEDDIQFVFPKDELDRVATLSDGGELRSTGFSVDISDRLSVNCTHWVTQGAGADSEYGIITWEALLPKLQCNVWSDNGDGSSGLVPNVEVSATLSDRGAIIMNLADGEFFHNERQGNQNVCAFSIQNQVFDYKKDWSAECPGRTATPPDLIEFSALTDGLYSRSTENCSIDPSTIGDRWFSHFRSVRKPEISGGYESDCSVLRTSSENQATILTASCNAEGEFSERQFRWQILSASSFVDLDARGGSTEFRLCEAETAPSEPANEWTSAIVHTGGYGRAELTGCIFDSDNGKSTAECLRDDGASEETIRFAEARATEGGEGPEVPVDFKELGKVDIAFLDSFTMSQNEWEYFVNTSPESISVPMYPERDLRLLASRGDRRAQAIIRQFPGATAWKPFVGGLRILPNGHQRFSTVIYWTENCRACPIVGYNVATVDFDQTGRFRAYETRGVFDNREHAKFMGMTASDLLRNEAAVQFYLNLRGYDAGPMDGAIGPRTRAAIADFQRENGVNSGSGQPDAATLAALVDSSTLFSNGGSRSPSEGTTQWDTMFSVIILDRPITWYEARDLARDMGGSLASIRSQEEQKKVWNAVRAQPDSWVRNEAGYLIGPWLGGHQLAGAGEPNEGWQWLDGTPFTFTNWITSNRQGGRQPNDSAGVEDALVFMGQGEISPGWNDYPSAPTGQGWQAQIRSFVLEKHSSLLAQCHVQSEPLNTGGIFANLVSRPLRGRTLSGNDWSLLLRDDRPSNFGAATFTNSLGEAAPGTWYVGGTNRGTAAVCQSYNGGSSSVCHEVLPCNSDAQSTFAMRNDQGEISSIVTSRDAIASLASSSTSQRGAPCDGNSNSTCFFDQAIAVVQSSGDAELLASIRISIASELLKFGDASRVADARAAADAYFAYTSEPDFRIVVNLGALIAADGDQAGSLRLARRYGAHQVDNAIAQISGKLHWFFDQYEQSLFFAQHINSAAYRDGVFEREAMRLGQDGNLSGARSFIARMSRPSSRASVLAQLSQESFRRGDGASGQSLLDEAIVQDSQVVRGGSEDKDIARALVLAGNTAEAVRWLNRSEGSWVRYTTGHTAAGLAEVGEVDMAMDLARRLSIFREYGSKVALDEIFNAVKKAGRYSDFENFASTLPDNGEDVSLSLLATAYAEDGRFPEAAAIVAKLSSPYEQHWANVSIARSYARSGNLVAANAMVASADTPENRAGILIEIGSQQLESSSGMTGVDLASNDDSSANPELGVLGSYESPWDYMEWVQVASRQNIDEAREIARQFISMFPKTQIFKASNGWYTVVVEYIDDHFDNKKRLAELIGSGQVPRDAILTSGSNFIGRFAANANSSLPVPEFVYATVVRDTRIGGETQADGSRYVGQEVTRAGTEVAVSGRFNDDCNLSRHGLAIVPCSDLSGIDSLPDSASAVSTGASNGDDSRQASDQKETPAAVYARINGDDLVDKLIAATTWGNSSVEREFLQELATISGADFRRLGDLEKLSRLTAILGMIEERAGVPAGSMELLNRVRNVRSGQHPTRDEVLRDSRWSLNEKKDFHVINIADPSRVEKYTRPEGAEAVFYNDPSGGWTILADGVNDATYNFVSDVPLLSIGIVNDNYQHTVLDVIPWVIWGATTRDTTSISERLALFENSGIYLSIQKWLTRLEGQNKPDDDPISTNDSSQKVDIRTASAPELAALLRAFGVTAENVSFVGGDVAAQTRDMERLIVAYQTDPPVVATPDLPLSTGYDPSNGILSACMPRDVLFPTDLLIGGEAFGARRAASIVIAPSDPITGLGTLPALCSVDMSKITAIEAVHGRGELERFSLTNPRGLFVRFRMTPAEAGEFLSALETGSARVGVDCEMKTMIKKPYTAVPYDYEKIGTCVPKSMVLKAYDFETGDQKFMQFSAGGTVFQSTSGVVKSTTPQPASDPSATAVAQTRAAWSFEVDGTGEAVVRDIVEGLEGTVAEIVLGYENAYPFQTAPTKKLAVRVFQALSENEVATRAGTERGYGSFVLKSWSDLNRHYYVDDPSSGLASAIVGTIDAIRILSARELAATSCEWSVTYRIWLRDMTPFGTALAASSTSDGFTFEACFRTTRAGYDIESYRYVDPN